ncbi:hypothetical protein VIGAN_02188700, partial [Vigna angularis var. angularis]
RTRNTPLPPYKENSIPKQPFRCTQDKRKHLSINRTRIYEVQQINLSSTIMLNNHMLRYTPTFTHAPLLTLLQVYRIVSSNNKW